MISVFFAFIGVVIIYYASYLFYAHKIIPSPYGPWRRYTINILAVLLIAVVYTLGVTHRVFWRVMPCVCLIIFLGLRFGTGIGWLQALFGANGCVLSAHCFRGIVISIQALVSSSGDGQYLLNPLLSYETTVIILPLTLVVTWLSRKIWFQNERMKVLADCPRQLIPVVVFEATVMLNLFIIDQGRLLSPDATWYAIMYLCSCLLTIGVLTYQINYAIHGAMLQNYQVRNKQLEEQYAIQLRHYHSYQQLMNNYRAFKHDNTAFLAALKALVIKGENAEAIKFLDQIEAVNERVSDVHKKYSDSVILDAMLLNLDDLCRENHIRLTLRMSVPRGTALSQMEAIRILDNATRNAVEACLKLPEKDRYIEISSPSRPGWVCMEIVNAYNGQCAIQNGMPVTRKKDKINHGLGLKIIREISEKYGGIVVTHPDAERKEFLLRVCVPKIQDDGEHTED